MRNSLILTLILLSSAACAGSRVYKAPIRPVSDSSTWVAPLPPLEDKAPQGASGPLVEECPDGT